jgi:hypothetical protein
MCSRLIERLQARFPATAILWHQTDQPVSADFLDKLVESLPALMELFPFQEPDWLAEAITEPEPVPTPQVSARIQPEPPPPLPPRAPPAHLPRMRNIELSRVRAALYDPVEGDLAPAPSSQLRLATHAMNATLIVVWLPLGAAVMTYSLLKGEDIHLSARLLVATGTIVGLVQTPFGQSMAAMAGV